MEAVPIAQIRSGSDLFYCEPYNCKLLARACVERQAKVASGYAVDTLGLCRGCALGAQVKKRAAGVVVDQAKLDDVARKTMPNRPAKLRGPKFKPTTAETTAKPARGRARYSLRRTAE